MEHLKTYEIFDFLKRKLKKPGASDATFNNIIEDCILPFKDNGFDVKRNGVRTTIHNSPIYVTTIKIEKDAKYFSFKEIKHDVLQLYNMLSDYDIDIKFTLIGTFKWEDKKKTVSAKDILKGLYDDVSVDTLTIDISRKG